MKVIEGALLSLSCSPPLSVSGGALLSLPCSPPLSVKAYGYTSMYFRHFYKGEQLS